MQLNLKGMEMHLLAPIVRIKPMKFPRKLKQFCMETWWSEGRGNELTSHHHTDLRGKEADVDADGFIGDRKWRRRIPCDGDVYWRPAARKDVVDEYGEVPPGPGPGWNRRRRRRTGGSEEG